MRTKLLAGVLLALPVALTTASPAPQVVVGPIRAAVLARDSTLALLRRGQLTRRDTTFACDSEADWPPEPTQRYFDRAGVLRVLISSGGSDDHAEDVRSIYDAAGRLRFDEWSLGSVSGANHHVRRYYDLAGRRVRRDATGSATDAYAGNEPVAVRDPRAYFADRCQRT